MARRPGGEAAVLGRLEAAPGLEEDETHSLAGLLDAEGHFAVVPNNGTGWRCECAIALRDDDGTVLESFRSRTGLGHLSTIPARNGSRPQIQWRIGTKLECLALVALLDDHPLRGRKSADYAVWRDAVSLCAAARYGLSPRTRERVSELAIAIRRVRAFDAARVDAVPPFMGDDGARSYFAGFFSGEGCFLLEPRRARFVIKLRRDDKPLLAAFRRQFGIGSVVDVATPPPWSPSAVWHVVSARDVLVGVDLFDSVDLLGRKARQYAAWRPGAVAIATAIVDATSVDADVVARAKADFANASAYRSARTRLPTDDARLAARSAYRTVLQKWASTVDGPLSCVVYAAARQNHPDWPKRETIAATFGSWYDALGDAGLADRAVRRRSRRPSATR